MATDHKKRSPHEQWLLRSLLKPSAYDPRPRRVRLVETHSAYVFLAAPHVYKVKKAVNLGFLDFSTLARRKRFCEREVELNRRLAPEVYLGVLPLYRHRGGLKWSGRGQPVEYAIQMRHLSERYFLDHLLRRGRVNRRDINRIVTRLVRFYRDQDPGPAVEAWGRRNRVQISTEENFRQTGPHIGRALTRAMFEAGRFYTRHFLRKHGRLFDRRVVEKRIRDCHGDLHLEHIHLTPRELNIYDCIEFNDRLRYVDVANDVAFLAMDLDFKGRPDLSRHLVEGVSRRLADPDMLRLMDFYKCYRAWVRGKVACLQAANPGTTTKDSEAAFQLAKQYFQLALRYACLGSRPGIVAVMGRIGSGKSTLAQQLGEVLGWTVHSSDQIRKSMAGLPVNRPSPDQWRSRLYSKGWTRRTYGRLVTQALEDVRAGRGAIIDATFGQPEWRNRLRTRLERHRVACWFVEARAPVKKLKRRLIARDNQSDVISDARLRDWSSLNPSFEPPVELPPGSLEVVSTAQEPGDAMGDLLHRWARRRAERP